jgi:hypothetical protein
MEGQGPGELPVQGLVTQEQGGVLHEVFYFQGNNNKGEETWSTTPYLDDQTPGPIIWTTEHLQEKNLLAQPTPLKQGTP